MLEKFKTIFSLHGNPAEISLGFAAGVFVSCTPFLGAHTLFAIAIAFVFRLNKIACIAGTWVNNPFTVAPIIVASYKVGSLLNGEAGDSRAISHLEWRYLKAYASPVILGSVIIGLFAAMLAYLVCYSLIVRFRQNSGNYEDTAGEATEEISESIDNHSGSDPEQPPEFRSIGH